MSLPEYTPSTYTVELLANQYKESDIHIKESELVTDEEVYAVVSKVMPALYLGFFLLVIILSGVLSQ
jgi:hypothetical protein